MAEEKKDKKAGVSLKAMVKLIMGVLFIVVGLLLIYINREELWNLIKGCIGLALVMIGGIVVAIAKE